MGYACLVCTQAKSGPPDDTMRAPSHNGLIDRDHVQGRALVLAAQAARTGVQVPLPIRKGFSKLHALTDSPLVLPLEVTHTATTIPLIGADTTSPCTDTKEGWQERQE